MIRVIKEQNGLFLSLGMFSDLDIAKNFFIRSQNVRGEYVLRIQVRNDKNEWETIEWARVKKS